MSRAVMTVVACALVLAVSPAANAQGSGAGKGDRVTLGVFLPTTMADGQKRFEVSEQLGQALEKRLGKPVVVKNFGRYEDFAQAAKSGLDVIVVDAWAAAHLGPKDEPVAMGVVGGDTHQRWGVVTAQRGLVKDLNGKRLAVPRGVRSLDAKFVSNVIFVGDLEAERHFKLESVPNAESALKMLESKAADAALVPLAHVPEGTRAVYRSARVPGVVVLSLKGDGASVRTAFEGMGAVGPFSGFTAPKERDLRELRDLLTRGVPKRQVVVAESPVVRPQPAAMVDVREVGLVLPTFLDMMDNSKETPDD